MKCYPVENFVIKLILCDFEGNIVLKLCAAVKIALRSCMFDANNISAGTLVISGPKGHVTRSNFSCNLQCNKRSCKKKFTCDTPFCNCCVASCKKSRMTLYFLQHCETSCLRATFPLQLERFFIRHCCIAVSCKKNCFG